ncbi:hypothetical protein [Geodermatophilus sp. DSM 45219]|uniref:hypothetical protein n=1 Tax=Geodermatophilus sp. DSM 45219 TaxID=1881103 RepID=UPI000882B8A1|nr:hypothetical protein [Geodermatophilus sp. DSM 45219]SDO37309.1 hypothetical protein SAMN05428965_3785 [Geodermatophilus sp. DSM 45219]
MDLIERVRRWAVARPCVLVVDVPGSTALRWTVEAELDRRGWPLALSPAGADLLLVVGTPGEDLAQAVDVVWSQVPGPRHRASISTGDEVSSALDAAVEALGEAAGRGQPGDDERPSPGDLLEQRGGGDHMAMEHGGTDADGHGEGVPHADGHAMDHAGMDHGAMGHGGHGEMDHSGHGGMDVAGLPMAGTTPDRDGLRLDALQVSLGPVLAGWPPGLLLHGQLQGDVLSRVRLTWVDADTGDERPASDSGDARLLALDHLSRSLEVAGWPTAARDARRARDRLCAADPADVEAGHRRAARLARRVRRSRTLAWSLRGIGVVGDAEAGPFRGDVFDRVRWWCELASAPEPPADVPPGLSLERVAGALDGAELAAARLVVASLPLSHPAARRMPLSARV